jgi:hypothetical protein
MTCRLKLYLVKDSLLVGMVKRVLFLLGKEVPEHSSEHPSYTSVSQVSADASLVYSSSFLQRPKSPESDSGAVKAFVHVFGGDESVALRRS